jgi:hypothetical protein
VRLCCKSRSSNQGSERAHLIFRRARFLGCTRSDGNRSGVRQPHGNVATSHFVTNCATGSSNRHAKSRPDKIRLLGRGLVDTSLGAPNPSRANRVSRLATAKLSHASLPGRLLVLASRHSLIPVMPAEPADSSYKSGHGLLTIRGRVAEAGLRSVHREGEVFTARLYSIRTSQPFRCLRSNARSRVATTHRTREDDLGFRTGNARGAHNQAQYETPRVVRFAVARRVLQAPVGPAPKMRRLRMQ